MLGIATPALKPHLRPVVIAGEGALLLSETGAHILGGNAYASVVPLIDGRRSAEEVVRAAAPALETAAAWYALLRLEAAGYLAEARPALDPDAAAFWSGFGVDAAAAIEALGAARVRVHAAGSSADDLFLAALRQHGIEATTDAGADSDLEIVLAGDYLDDGLLPFDEAARAAGRRWMLVRPAGLELWIGPLFEPGRTACLHCLRYRLSLHRAAHEFAAARSGGQVVTPPLPTTLAVTDAACRMAAIEVAKILAGVESGLAGSIATLDLRDRSTHRHRLVRHPGCDACSERRKPTSTPLRLQCRLASVNTDSGYRISTPDATLQRYDHLISPVTGIVKALVPDPEGNVQSAGHTYVAEDRARIRPVRLNQLNAVFRSCSAGKGTTDSQARASALCEAIERYSARRHGYEPTRVATYRELGADAIHPNDVMRFSERQYRERDAWNATESALHTVPEPFDPDARIEWTPIWSLTAHRHRLLPTDMLFMAYDLQSHPHGVGCSNGCAAGNSLEEAVLQGLCEVVERDAVAVWWYNRLRMPAVDITTFGDPWLSEVPAHYDALGRDVTVLDLTHDLRIPAFAALSHLRAGAQERITLGFGCHPDPHTAARRAVLEMSQVLATDIHGRAAADDQVWKIGAWLAQATRANQPYLVPDATISPRTPADFEAAPGADLLEAIERIRRAVEVQGMEMLVLDQTRPDVGMPVVKVVVPGMRHFWARFAPGRLYDVPVKMGWVDRPTAEQDLNPIPFFF